MRARWNLLALVVCSLIILIVYRFPIGAGQMRYSMELIFRLMIAVVTVGVAWRVNRPVAAFLALALFSQFYPMFDSGSARAFYNVFCGVVLYVILIEYGRNWSTALMDMLCVVALLHMVFVILQAFDVHLLWKNAGGTVTGIMENQNSGSALLALCFPAFLRGKWKWLSPLIVLGLFLTKSSGGMVAVAVGFGFYALVTVEQRKFLFPIGMGIVLMVALFIGFFDEFDSRAIRLNVWNHAWEVFKDNWVVGCSIGRWKTEFIYLVVHKGFPEGFVRLHSTILQSMMEMGIGFLIILIWYLANIIRRSWKSLATLVIPLTAIIIIMVNGSVNFLIRIAPNAAIVIVWLAIMEISLRNARPKEQTAGA
jgi:hypothetical protein